MTLYEQYEKRRKGLEKDIEEANKLIAELQGRLANTQDEFERGKIEVNIHDVNRQLRDWEYALHDLTDGKE